MESRYTTVLDAGAAQIPPVPLYIALAIPVLLLAFGYVARARSWRSATGPIQLVLWTVYLSYAPIVVYQYWTLWHGRTAARDATRMSIEAGPLDTAALVRVPEGLFVETNQRFAVNGVDFEYRHLRLRYLGFLLPQTEPVALPLEQDAQVRVTYRHDDGQKELLRFEIATGEPTAHD